MGLTSQHLAYQLNTLLGAVETDYFMELDDDDELLPGAVAALMPHVKLHQITYGWEVVGNCPRIDAAHLRPDQEATALDNAWWVSASAAVVPTGLARRVGGWPMRYHSGQFWDDDEVTRRGRWPDRALWSRLVEAGATWRMVPEVVWRLGYGPHERLSAGRA
jgi:hypothetical protein